MNFLAHLFLSCEQEELLVGNFLADLIKNRDLDSYPVGIQEGVQLHRKIDQFTDQHPMVSQGVHRLHPFHRKYASVIVDVFYDYLLAKNWSLYTDEDFIAFTKRVYLILEKYQSIMPPKIQIRLSNMIAGDWLIGYSKYEGLDFTFDRMQFRLSKPEQLKGVIENLQRFETEFDQEFKVFFPEVIDFVNRECGCPTTGGSSS